ncbi:phosphatidylinositol-glycan biosynthesis class F protein [Microplitis demolitor]|uniref:phosphatidylinositol-glycan biosynthesis class F protein n=1 Tax=Microplitis demolitor TaxID=69319 RepID=UPI0004CCF78E|nr:phosphatidylinositol-glycan biosynthesis class F protein [Microplitis demolitor]
MLTRRLLLYNCLFTSIYFSSILIILKYNDTLYNVDTYKYIPTFIILSSELIKYTLSKFYISRYSFDRIDSKVSNSKYKKIWPKVFKDIIKFIIIIFMLFIVYYIGIVLFGAPLITHQEETTMLAVILSELTFIPASIQLGIDDTLTLLTLFPLPSNNIIAEAMDRNIKSTVLGTWLGAIVIPLDWDRPWQEWPIPCAIGALIGYIVANFICFIKLLPVYKFFRSKKFDR